ncbi:pentatricopeptide repeat-containing protein At2g01860 [Abrus precatorius]|uniref:Pentatricopeptide repeat-containing protein At2g01860 n=1 Tax=Abrus precatorius TaxID=3816 RepID=A0A8B8KX21_ABRPR|nr:pentatricopeptide repeat-containing protein At2g01860 [Abrus precatorius]XP_027348514.1 pentatricopeptide repeat-containing protein At2g01860 [Abrus precatorius]XP_027348515.1 pentatricopeptide repeat-containing protein At2g01860 [Abrus precatorius]XP_027348516.1 pentatricopeptide repeat-containing protein At2g01860 [Abrus precatorius]XP_027348517.1 pentatricopeptide repeat-containing protein At2g01860 [Abrus precatorius]XP_027348518.1 pentatricopeptide repeat-containing protein At2g01860 [
MMYYTVSFPSMHFVPVGRSLCRYKRLTLAAHSKRKRRPPQNRRYQPHPKQPPEFGVNLFLKKPSTTSGPIPIEEDMYEGPHEEEEENIGVVWESDELEAIASLFQGRIPQKPGKLNRKRPLPLPIPCKLRPLGLPTPKSLVKLTAPGVVSSRASVAKKVYKSPSFLIGLAREISRLGPDEDVSKILGKWVQFLRKGSLSLTIRELGHMGCAERALQTFLWAQNQSHLFPDDWILASTVEVLARSHELKIPFNIEQFTGLASRGVLEAMIRGFIKGGNLRLAWKVLAVARRDKRMLNSSIYAKLILELGKNPDRHRHVVPLLDELGERDELNLSQQDCTAIMKVCTKMGKYEVVESLFSWFKQSGNQPSVVMFTSVIHSRYMEKKYREALAVVWEMEASNCLFDLPAYRVVIKLFVALNDLSRAMRYFSKLKEAGFSPSYGIYKDMLQIYMASERISKCKDICMEAEIAGFELDKYLVNSEKL